MAIKQKEKTKKSRLWEMFSTVTKWENYFFVVISLLTLLLGILILTGVLSIKSGFPVIGSYPTAFAWILVVISGFGLIYALYPFFKPAYPELKKVTWPRGRQFAADTFRVFVFIMILSLLFMAYDIIISAIMGAIL